VFAELFQILDPGPPIGYFLFVLLADLGSEKSRSPTCGNRTFFEILDPQILDCLLFLVLDNFHAYTSQKKCLAEQSGIDAELQLYNCSSKLRQSASSQFGVTESSDQHNISATNK